MFANPEELHPAATWGYTVRATLTTPSEVVTQLQVLNKKRDRLLFQLRQMDHEFAALAKVANDDINRRRLAVEQPLRAHIVRHLVAHLLRLTEKFSDLLKVAHRRIVGAAAGRYGRRLP